MAGKTICIYHDNCFDGICAAWVVKRRFPDAELVGMNYGNENFLKNIQEDCHNDRVSEDRFIMVDFSMPRKMMELLHSKAELLLVFDHHKSAQLDCEGLDYCTFDLDESGASLAWKKLFPYDTMPTLVRYIKDRDLWLFHEPDSHAVNSFIQSFPMTVEKYEWLFNYLQNDLNIQSAIGSGQSIERYKETMVQKLCDTAILIQGIPTVNTSVLFSEVPHELCKRYPHAPYAQYYWDNLQRGIRIYGLRSIGEYDVSVLARQYGGGGHKNAAGYQIPIPEED